MCVQVEKRSYFRHLQGLGVSSDRLHAMTHDFKTLESRDSVGFVSDLWPLNDPADLWPPTSQCHCVCVSTVNFRGRLNAAWRVSAETETRPKLYTIHSAESESRPKVHSNFRPKPKLKPKPNVYCPMCVSVRRAFADTFVGRSTVQCTPHPPPIHAPRTHASPLIRWLLELCIQATAADFRQPAESTTHFRPKPKVSRKFQFDFRQYP